MIGDKVEVLTPEKLNKETVVSISDEYGNELNEINPGKTDQKAIVVLKHKYPADTFIRKEIV
jgi:hypothetical protein